MKVVRAGHLMTVRPRARRPSTGKRTRSLAVCQAWERILGWTLISPKPMIFGIHSWPTRLLRMARLWIRSRLRWACLICSLVGRRGQLMHRGCDRITGAEERYGCSFRSPPERYPAHSTQSTLHSLERQSIALTKIRQSCQRLHRIFDQLILLCKSMEMWKGRLNARED